MTWSAETSAGYEQDKIAAFVVPYTRGTGIDVGCGPRRCWPHMIGVDRMHGPEVDIVTEADDLSMFADAGLDFVFSSHCLEDLEDTEKTLREWWRVVRPDGHLVLYLPHKDLYPNVGQPGANPAHKHDFEPMDILSIMESLTLYEGAPGWDLVENEVRGEGEEYSFFQVFRKRRDGEVNIDVAWERHPGGKDRALVVRVGAIGDMIMASAVFPGLKELGYHVTLLCTPAGKTVVEENPFIDAFWAQDKDQVPGIQLDAYLRTIAPRFDRIVNLSESVEVSLLMVKGRSTHWHDLPARRKLVGSVNYLDRQCDIAGVPRDPGAARFHSTKDEQLVAELDRVNMGLGPVVYWVLSGTSMHKVYPFTQVVVGWLLQRTNASVVLMGGEHEADLASMVEVSLRHEEVADLLRSSAPVDLSRLFKLTGDWPIRRALAFLEVADVVVGPETGALNAAAMLKVPKVVMLSHSSHENLTKHWNRTIVLEPPQEACPCFPCHAMHYDWSDCHQAEKLDGIALCAAEIKPEVVYHAITFALGLEDGFGLRNTGD